MMGRMSDNDYTIEMNTGAIALSELIAKLQRIRDEHGDLPVVCDTDNGEGVYCESAISDARFCPARTDELPWPGPVYRTGTYKQIYTDRIVLS